MLGQNLVMSLKTMVLGLGTVFVALVALIYVIELINKVINLGSNREGHNGSKAKGNEGITESEPNPEPEFESILEDEDDEEIVAVITAAIAASLNRSTHDIVVKSVRRIPNNSPAWSRASRNEQIAGRL